MIAIITGATGDIGLSEEAKTSLLLSTENTVIR